jgi:pimeloyl-ACP methyl ester carboxylesterase
MPYLPTLDQKIFYTKQGDGSPPALLLVHGACGSHLDWPPEIRQLNGTFVYAIDLPGHGRSKGAGKNRIADYASDVIHLINTLSLNNVVVAGYSMGGAVAQEIGLRKIQAVSGLVLISTGAHLPVGDSILDFLSTDYTRAIDSLLKLSWSRDASEHLVALAKERQLDIDQEVAFKDFTACKAFDLRGEIAAIDLPTLVISGSVDRMVPPQYGRMLTERLSNARPVQIDGGAHMVFLEKPAVVAGAITTFLEDLRKIDTIS